MSEFNLIDQKWIPCIDHKGHRIEYGVRETFMRAHELREICDESPLVTVAIHRLLLAILYRAYKGPSDIKAWSSIYQKECFAPKEAMDQYLDKLFDRFYLFDDKHPFMQVSGLDLNEYSEKGILKKDNTDGLMRLVREAPAKGGKILFDHRTGTERPEYYSNQIVKMLLSAQSFSGTGIARSGKIGNQDLKPTPCQFAPCDEGLLVWLQGENLFQTLLFNLITRDFDESDKPAWEDDQIVDTAIKSWAKPLHSSGPVQRFAELSRFVRLIDQTSMFFTNGLKTIRDHEDPMKAYYRKNPKDEFLPIKLRSEKAAWRDIHALFSVKPALIKPPECMNHMATLQRRGFLARSFCPKTNIVGIVTDQGKVSLWRHERIPVPLEILISGDLKDRLEGLIKVAETVGDKLSSGLFWNGSTKKCVRKDPVGRIQAIADLAIAPNFNYKKPGFIRSPEGRLPADAHNKSVCDLCESLDPRPAYWARLENHFLTLLSCLPDDWDGSNNEWKSDQLQSATNAWRKMIKLEAHRALEESTRSLGTTARAIQAIARVGTKFSDNDLIPMAVKTEKQTRSRKESKQNEP